MDDLVSSLNSLRLEEKIISDKIATILDEDLNKVATDLAAYNASPSSWWKLHAKPKERAGVLWRHLGHSTQRKSDQFYDLVRLKVLQDRYFKALKAMHTFVLQPLKQDQGRWNEMVKSLNWYTQGNYKDFNTSLRTKSVMTKVQSDNLVNIDTFFSYVPPITVDIVCFRGSNIDVSGFKQELGYLSTSYHEDVAINFATGTNCCENIILIKAGSKVLCLESISNFPEEFEVLVERGGSIELISKQKTTVSYYGAPYLMEQFFMTFTPNIEDVERRQRLKYITDDPLHAQQFYQRGLYENPKVDMWGRLIQN